MEDVLELLGAATIPLIVGFSMALTLSRFVPWSKPFKWVLGLSYEVFLFFGLFLFQPYYHHAWLLILYQEFRAATTETFGVAIAMSMVRLANTKARRITAGLFICFYLALLWMNVGAYIEHAVRKALTATFPTKK